MTGFRIEALTSEHRRDGFSCGVAILDRYIIEIATQDMKRRVSNCFVCVDDHDIVVGYYTFAATGIPLADLPQETSKRLPRYPLIPAALIGRLAVTEKARGQRLGGALILDAVLRAAQADPAIFALVVDAKDDKAVAFYEHLGFQRFLSRSMSLFLPIATALRSFKHLR